MKCPCLKNDVAPICRADGDAMHIPSSEQLAGYCLTPNYRRCQLFRRFLVALTETPERWRSNPADYGAAGRTRRGDKGD